MDEGSSCFSHGFSLKVELVGVVDEAVEDGVGEGGVADGRRSRIRANVNWESLVERHTDEVMTENPDEDPVGVRGRRRPGAKTKSAVLPTLSPPLLRRASAPVSVSLIDTDASMSTSASNRQSPGPARSCRRGAPRQPAQSLPEDWIASGQSVGSHRVRGHRVRGKLHQPHDLTTFFSACPARIPDFLLAFPAVTNGLRSGFRGHAAERIRTSHAVMVAALAQTIRSKVSGECCAADAVASPAAAGVGAGVTAYRASAPIGELIFHEAGFRPSAGRWEPAGWSSTVTPGA